MFSLLIETILLIIITLIVYFFEPQSSELFAYYHMGIEQWQVWRLITATFCHTNFYHLAMNLLGLIVIIGLFIDTYKKQSTVPVIIFSSIFIALTLFYFEPGVIWYVGFSGVLHALFSYAVANDIQYKQKWGIALGFALVAKILYEQVYGAQPSTIELIDAPVLINAHLYGAIAGVLFYFLRRFFISIQLNFQSKLD